VDRLNLEIPQGEILGWSVRTAREKPLRSGCCAGSSIPPKARRGSRAVTSRGSWMPSRIASDTWPSCFGLYGDLTVDENMVFYADLFASTGSERDDLTARLLRMTRMEPFRAAAPATAEEIAGPILFVAVGPGQLHDRRNHQCKGRLGPVRIKLVTCCFRHVLCGRVVGFTSFRAESGHHDAGAEHRQG